MIKLEKKNWKHINYAKAHQGLDSRLGLETFLATEYFDVEAIGIMKGEEHSSLQAKSF